MSHQVIQLPQILDLIVDPQITRSSRLLGIVPAAGNPGVVGAAYVAGQRVSHQQAVVPGNAVDMGKDIVKIGGAGLAGSGLLRD